MSSDSSAGVKPRFWPASYSGPSGRNGDRDWQINNNYERPRYEHVYEWDTLAKMIFAGYLSLARARCDFIDRHALHSGEFGTGAMSHNYNYQDGTKFSMTCLGCGKTQTLRAIAAFVEEPEK